MTPWQLLAEYEIYIYTKDNNNTNRKSSKMCTFANNSLRIFPALEMSENEALTKCTCKLVSYWVIIIKKKYKNNLSARLKWMSDKWVLIGECLALSMSKLLSICFRYIFVFAIWAFFDSFLAPFCVLSAVHTLMLPLFICKLVNPVLRYLKIAINQNYQ